MMPKCMAMGRSRSGWLKIGLTAALFGLVTSCRPFSFLFGWQGFEARHGVWPERAALLCLLIVLSAAYRRYVEKISWTQDLDTTRTALEQGTIRRMPFAMRLVFLVSSLVFLLFAMWQQNEQAPVKHDFIFIATFLYLLFVFFELSHVLFLGDGHFYDPEDEMQEFFRFRALRSGYAFMVMASVSMVLILLLQKSLALYAAPVLLAASLMVPNIILLTLNRKAGLPDEGL